MSEKLLLGCVYCERTDVDLHLCCRHHARLVCDECEKGAPFLLEHQPAKAA